MAARQWREEATREETTGAEARASEAEAWCLAALSTAHDSNSNLNAGKLQTPPHTADFYRFTYQRSVTSANLLAHRLAHEM